MTKKYLFSALITAFLITATPAWAIPSFDTGNLGAHLKELVKRESRNKFMKAAEEYVTTANAVMGALDTIKQIIAPINIGTTSFAEWSPVVPKNVAKVLKDKEPKLSEVKEEIEKIVFIDPTTPETLKKSRQQQALLLMKILSFSYAAAERSLELSMIGYAENEAFRERVEKENNIIALYQQMAILQMFSTRKNTEILNLQSRILEVDSMSGLINKEKSKTKAPKQDDTTPKTDTPIKQDTTPKADTPTKPDVTPKTDTPK